MWRMFSISLKYSGGTVRIYTHGLSRTESLPRVICKNSLRRWWWYQQSFDYIVFRLNNNRDPRMRHSKLVLVICCDDSWRDTTLLCCIFDLWTVGICRVVVFSFTGVLRYADHLRPTWVELGKSLRYLYLGAWRLCRSRIGPRTLWDWASYMLRYDMAP